jgi:hypothetical protein
LQLSAKGCSLLPVGSCLKSQQSALQMPCDGPRLGGRRDPGGWGTKSVVATCYLSNELLVQLPTRLLFTVITAPPLAMLPVVVSPL